LGNHQSQLTNEKTTSNESNKSDKSNKSNKMNKLDISDISLINKLENKKEDTKEKNYPILSSLYKFSQSAINEEEEKTKSSNNDCEINFKFNSDKLSSELNDKLTRLNEPTNKSSKSLFFKNNGNNGNSTNSTNSTNNAKKNKKD